MMDRVLETEAIPVDVGDFEEFFNSERDRLFRVLVLATRDASEAEELMQDAFLRVWERWPRVSRMDAGTAYLHRVAFNAFLSRRRRAAVALRRRMFSVAATPDEIAHVEARHMVIQLLRGLPARQRAAVVLIDVLDYSSEAAGELLGIRASTARELASRGRAHLRERMSEQDE